MTDDVRNTMDLGNWAFLRTGWWVLHIIAILAVGYIGYWIGVMK
jgi:hypothetical protein